MKIGHSAIYNDHIITFTIVPGSYHPSMITTTAATATACSNMQQVITNLNTSAHVQVHNSKQQNNILIEHTHNYT